MINREMLSAHYARGRGLEIGAYHSPFPIFRNQATVIYLDKRPHVELLEMKKQDKNIHPSAIIPFNELVDDGQTLSTISDSRYDFIISSHQLEHCASPLNALENQMRVLKPGGVGIYALPTRDNPIDKNRPVTSLNHIVDNYYLYNTYCDIESLENELEVHYLEYLRNVDHITGDEANQITRERIKSNADIHFHVFSQEVLIGMIAWTQECLKYSFHVELFNHVGQENFFVLRRI